MSMVPDTQRVEQQPNANALPLEIWLVNIFPLIPLHHLLPLCSTSKWLGDELKHDVVLKAALAKGGFGGCILCFVLVQVRHVGTRILNILLFFPGHGHVSSSFCSRPVPLPCDGTCWEGRNRHAKCNASPSPISWPKVREDGPMRVGSPQQSFLFGGPQGCGQEVWGLHV